MNALRISAGDQNHAPILQSIGLEGWGRIGGLGIGTDLKTGFPLIGIRPDSPIPVDHLSNHSTRGHLDFSHSQVALFLLPANLFSL